MYKTIERVLEEGKKIAVCTIVDTKGSTPLSAGAKMIVTSESEIFGSVGGGNLEMAVVQLALKVIEKGKPELFHHNLLEDLQMCCGGAVDIFIEPVMKNKKLYIFGAGHVGKALVRHAENLDFDITVIDDRKKIFSDWPMGRYTSRIGDYKEIVNELNFDNPTYVVIATYDHTYDREILASSLKKPHAYIGMIGSRNKIAVTKKMFVEKGGFKLEELESVDMPIGLDINAKTADEIAISIVAKLVMEKNKK